MSPDAPGWVEVTGGANGVEAHYRSMLDLAATCAQVAANAAGHAFSLHRYLLDPDIVGSALLDPIGVLDFTAELAVALDGPLGLVAAAATAALMGGSIATAAELYATADTLEKTLEGVATTLAMTPVALSSAFATAVSSGSLSPAWQRLLTENPRLVDLFVNAVSVSSGGVGPLVGEMGLLFPDGRAEVRSGGNDTRPEATAPPRSLAGLIRGLALRNEGEHGEIDVKILTNGDGTRHVIVDIPGTKNWDLGSHNSDITSLATNVRGIEGRATSYGAGVMVAMKAAGVRADDKVMLVGHSEGGMVAVTVARDVVKDRSFNVTHVVTAGSPIGLSVGSVPAKVKVLAIENKTDAVPHLDGAGNPDRLNVTTAEVRHGDMTIGDDHSISNAYVPGAADIDASADKSITDFRRSADGFFQADSVEAKRYVITRSY